MEGVNVDKLSAARCKAIKDMKTKGYPPDEIYKAHFATPDDNTLAFIVQLLSPYAPGQYEIYSQVTKPAANVCNSTADVLHS